MGGRPESGETPGRAGLARGLNERVDVAAATRRPEWVAPALRAVGAVALVVAVTRPVARTGLGSALALHELFDLLLSGRLPFGLPRWLGLFGYLPAIGGALVLIGEAPRGRAGPVLRWVGVSVAVVSVAVLALGGPWRRPGLYGVGLYWAFAGCILVVVGLVVGALSGRSAGRRDVGHRGSVSTGREAL